MFDKVTAAGLLGFTEPLFDIGKISIGLFEVYPVITVAVYAVFMALCLGVALLIYWLTRNQRRGSKESLEL